MVFLYISVLICQGTIKHVMQQCRGRAHNVDIVLVAQISIFTQTMGAGGWLRQCLRKKRKEGILQFSSDSPKH